jgi:hypothetical protein
MIRGWRQLGLVKSAQLLVAGLVRFIRLPGAGGKAVPEELYMGVSENKLIVLLLEPLWWLKAERFFYCRQMSAILIRSCRESASSRALPSDLRKARSVRGLYRSLP